MHQNKATHPDPSHGYPRAADRVKALDAFMNTKSQIDAMLERLRALSGDHFDTNPDQINSGDVGILNQYASLLRQITDCASWGPTRQVAKTRCRASPLSLPATTSWGTP